MLISKTQHHYWKTMYIFDWGWKNVIFYYSKMISWSLSEQLCGKRASLIKDEALDELLHGDEKIRWDQSKDFICHSRTQVEVKRLSVKKMDV